LAVGDGLAGYNGKEKLSLAKGRCHFFQSDIAVGTICVFAESEYYSRPVLIAKGIQRVISNLLSAPVSRLNNPCLTGLPSSFWMSLSGFHDHAELFSNPDFGADSRRV
jgi:hypothetical protein